MTARKPAAAADRIEAAQLAALAAKTDRRLAAARLAEAELAALCREARGLGPVRAYTEQERRWIDGRRIYDARRSLGLTQAEAADRIGVSSVSMSNWEHGRCYCDADIIIAALQDPARNRVPRRFVAPKPLKEDRP